MHKPFYFNFEKVNSTTIVLWCNAVKTFKGSLCYFNKIGSPDLYKAILSIYDNNSDSNRLMYIGVINDYIEMLKRHSYRHDKRIGMLTLLNNLNYRIKLIDRT